MIMQSDKYKELKAICYTAVKAVTNLRPVFRQDKNTIEIYLPEVAENSLQDIIYNLIKTDKFNTYGPNSYSFKIFYDKESYAQRISEAMFRNRTKSSGFSKTVPGM